MRCHLLLLVIGLQLGWCCQPPLPAFHQVPPAPPPAPPLPQAPQLPLQQNSLVSGVQQHTSPNSGPAISNSLDQELTPFSQRSDQVPRRTFTPYPGYIPPPPENQGHTVPVRENGIQNVALDDTEGVNGCPQVMTSLNHVFACLQMLPPIPNDETALKCSFESGTKCRMQPTSPAFQVARFPTPAHYRAVARLAGRPETDQPQGDFLALIERQGTPNEEYVISTPVVCQNGSGILTLDFWFLGNPDSVIQVCTQDVQARSCTKEILHFPGTSVTIQVVHPASTVFDVEIVVSNITRPTLLIIDNLDYKAELCEGKHQVVRQSNNVIEATPSSDIVDSFFEDEGIEGVEQDQEQEQDQNDDESGSVPSRPTSETGPVPPEQQAETGAQDDDFVPVRDGPPSMSPFDLEIRNSPLQINKLNPCSQLSCDFNVDFCGYKNYRNDSKKTHEWQWGSSRVGNPHTGIKEKNADGGFLFVGTDTDENTILTYLLESPTLQLNEDAELQMDLYRRSRDITLQVCLNSTNYCPLDAPSYKKETDWIQGVKFPIPQSTTKIYLKAIQWRKFKWLAIDNIRIFGPKECS